MLINLTALKVWDSFIFVKKSFFLNTSTVANRKEIIGQAQKMFRESLEWEKQQKLHLPQGSTGRKIQQLRDYLIRRLQRGIPYCRLNGSLTNRLPGNCNISFQFIEGNELLLLLDEKNICASAASACSTGDTSPSHVLTAMGIPEKLARGTLRLTIGYQNTQEEIDYTVQCIKEAVEKLRENAEDYRRYKETFPCNIM